MSQITYAKANDPKCRGLRVFDRDTGAEIMDVGEVNTERGWMVRKMRDNSGKLVTRNGYIVWEHLIGNFIIRRPEECA